MPDERFFKGAAHRVDAIEDGDLPGRNVPSEQCLDLPCHGIGLGRLVLVALHGHLALVGSHRDQSLLLAIRIRAIRLSAAFRIAAVLRKFSSSLTITACGQSFSKARMLRISAPRQR